jgi:hypothetical protein
MLVRPAQLRKASPRGNAVNLTGFASCAVSLPGYGAWWFIASAGHLWDKSAHSSRGRAVGRCPGRPVAGQRGKSPQCGSLVCGFRTVFYRFVLIYRVSRRPAALAAVT